MLFKCEIDVVKQQQLLEAVDFAVIHKCAALVVQPELVSSAIVSRGARRGNFAVLTTVDTPKGDQFKTDKFRGMQVEAIGADGYEILLSDRTAVEIVEEIKYLSKFHDAFIGNTKLLRFVIGTHLDRSEQSYQTMCEACRLIPLPNMIRTSAATKMPVMKSTVEEHNKIYNFIKSHVNIPIKISGNVDAKIYANVKADRFAVSLEQAQKLVKELRDTEEVSKAVKNG